MNTLTEQLAYRLKAVLYAVFVAAVGIAEWLVNDPTTAQIIEPIIPAPFDKFVPGALGFIGLYLVHHFPNAEKPISSSDTAPVTELPETPRTTAISTIR